MIRCIEPFYFLFYSVTKEEKVVPSTSTDKPMPGKRPPMRTEKNFRAGRKKLP